MTDAQRPAFVIDMNLSTRWVDSLVSIGYDATHWSDVGKFDSPDTDIMRWARANGRVVFTFDLDFGTALALTHADGPSVLQVRMSEALPRQILHTVRLAIDHFRDHLASGAIVTVEDRQMRVRILPF